MTSIIHDERMEYEGLLDQCNTKITQISDILDAKVGERAVGLEGVRDILSRKLIGVGDLIDSTKLSETYIENSSKPYIDYLSLHIGIERSSILDFQYYNGFLYLFHKNGIMKITEDLSTIVLKYTTTFQYVDIKLIEDDKIYYVRNTQSFNVIDINFNSVYGRSDITNLYLNHSYSESLVKVFGDKVYLFFYGKVFVFNKTTFELLGTQNLRRYDIFRFLSKGDLVYYIAFDTYGTSKFFIEKYELRSNEVFPVFISEVNTNKDSSRTEVYAYKDKFYITLHGDTTASSTLWIYDLEGKLLSKIISSVAYGLSKYSFKTNGIYKYYYKEEQDQLYKLNEITLEEELITVNPGISIGYLIDDYKGITYIDEGQYIKRMGRVEKKYKVLSL